MRGWQLALLTLLLGLLATVSTAAVPSLSERQEKAGDAQPASWVSENYAKREYRVPMRDGVRLFTAVYVPKDASPANTYPILFNRTPYGVSPYGESDYPGLLGPSELFTRSKYIFVYQDVRGRFMSEGEFVNMRPYISGKSGPSSIDESSDAYDTIDWLLKNVSFHNGKVGMWGISYPGFYVSEGMIDAHPALRAVSPQGPIGDWFLGDDFHHNGALYLAHMFAFMYSFGQPRAELTTKWPAPLNLGTSDGYEFFQKLEPLSLIDEKYYRHVIAWWEQMAAHPNYDSFWKMRSVPQFLRDIKPAVLVVGGWFDAEDLWGSLHSYDSANRQSPGGNVRLVMGPWCHGCWARSDGDQLGDILFGAKTSVFYRERIEFPFFEHYLKGKDDTHLPEAYVFETGSNQWHMYDAWPPPNVEKVSLYLGQNGALAFAPPKHAAPAYDEYVSDPAKPVPFSTAIAFGMTREYMTGDQRLLGRRTDVLTYQTEPLDHDITFAGPVRPSLSVSTSGTDSDWIVKLIDVYPDDYPEPARKTYGVPMAGYQQLVRGEDMRGRFRESYEHPEAFTPDAVTRVEYVMPDINHTFLRGHRIMVQIQSTWFPLVDLNPQKFVPDIYKATAADFQRAAERVYHSPENSSRIDLWMLKR